MPGSSKTKYKLINSSWKPIIYLILVNLIGLLLFQFIRGIFLSNFLTEITGEPFSEIFKAFAIGMRFDQVVILYALIPLFVFVPWVKRFNTKVRLPIILYATLIFSFLTILMLADIRFYTFLGNHLNFLAIEYIDGGSLFYNLILTDEKLYLYLFIWLLTTFVVYLLLSFLAKKLLPIKIDYSFLTRILVFLTMCLLIVGGIRGSLSISPIDWGEAYFSKNRFLNQLALNGVYTLGRTVTEKNHDPRLWYKNPSERFPFVPFDVGITDVKKMISQKNQTWDDNAFGLQRKVHQAENGFGFRPNIILIVMEGWSGEYTGALGSSLGVTPRFDSLSKEGLFFNDFYANGTRTGFGLAASLCSFPSLPGRSILKRYDAKHPFNSLPEILKERGYYNAFYYGGDLDFDNMEGFFKTKNVDYFYDQFDFPDEKEFSKWGIPDDIGFQKLTSDFDTLPRPTFTTFLTLSNHHPFDLPDSTFQKFKDTTLEAKVHNAIYYADHTLGEFVESTKTKPWYDSTIFVFVPDHTQLGNQRALIRIENYQIPLLIYSPLIEAKIITKTGSQVDLIPTVMHLLGSDYLYKGWGKNLLLEDSSLNFAVVNCNQRIGIITASQIYAEMVGLYDTLFYREQTTVDSIPGSILQQYLRSYIQIADILTIDTLLQ